MRDISLFDRSSARREQQVRFNSSAFSFAISVTSFKSSMPLPTRLFQIGSEAISRPFLVENL